MGCFRAATGDGGNGCSGWLKSSCRGVLAVADAKFDELYTIGKKLGAGAFGEVFSAVNKATLKGVAVKKIKKNMLFTPEERTSVSREVRWRPFAEGGCVRSCTVVVRVAHVITDEGEWRVGVD